MGLPWAETALTKKSDGLSSETDEIDAVGFYYLSLALYPLVAGWAVYVMILMTHPLHVMILMIYPLRFCLIRGTLMVVHSEVGCKLPLPLYADVRTFRRLVVMAGTRSCTSSTSRGGLG